VSRYQKGKTKTNLDFLKQETVSGSGVSGAICKSATRPRQITMPASHHSVFFTGHAHPTTQPTASSTEGTYIHMKICEDKTTKQERLMAELYDSSIIVDRLDFRT